LIPKYHNEISRYVRELELRKNDRDAGGYRQPLLPCTH
jgi:hypothetical protein